MKPAVSVIIPTYNRRDLLEQAIQSCFVGNDALDVEVIVVDDGSADGTRDFLGALSERNERMRVIFQEHQGAQVARNRGKAEARGAFVKFLDSDDQLVAGALVEEVDVLEHSEAAISYGDLRIREAGSEERIFRQGDATDLAAGVLEGTIWTHPHVFTYRQEVLADVEWDTSIPYEQDYAFAVHAATQGFSATYAGQVVACLNEHAGPRISTTVKSSVDATDAFLRRIEIIEQGVRRLQERRLLRPHHRQAAARGMWRWSYMMAAYDFGEFKRCYRKIKRIAPDFCAPRTSAALRALDQIASPVTTERMVYPLRKAKQLFSL